MRQLCLMSALVLAACGAGGGAPSTGPTAGAGSAAATPDAAPAPPPPPRIAGAWTGDRITGHPVGAGGLVASSAGPIALVSEEGGDWVAVATLAKAWEIEKLVTRSVIRGHIATRGADIALTAVEVQALASPISSEIVFLVPGGKPESIRDDCGLLAFHALTFDSKGPLVVTGCADTLAVYARGKTGWTIRASWPKDRGLLTHAVVDRADRIHILMNDHFILDGADPRQISLPPETRLGMLGECGGTVYGTFTQPTGAGLMLGRYDDATGWTLEDVWTGPEAYGPGLVGFDEACRPFVGMEDMVWSRGKAGWVKASIGRDRAPRYIEALVGHGGALYAQYEEITNGVATGIATAPLVEEAP
jgi:hypothetical protein